MSKSDKTYLNYTSDAEHFAEYEEYQARYRDSIRESDRVLIGIVEELAKGREGDLNLLDIGCSTGNLLLHLKHQLPNLKLTGADLFEPAMVKNRETPHLSGIDFEVLDVVKNVPEGGPYDFIVANALFMVFDDSDYEASVANIAKALKPGGYMLAFDVYNPFNQGLAIIETTEAHPQGLGLYIRSYRKSDEMLAAGGFEAGDYRKFEIPIDLELKDYEQYGSYTVTSEAKERLLFRGSLFQPWHHLVAKLA